MRKTKTYNINNNIYTDEHVYNKQRHVNNDIINAISKHKLSLIVNMC